MKLFVLIPLLLSILNHLILDSTMNEIELLKCPNFSNCNQAEIMSPDSGLTYQSLAKYAKELPRSKILKDSENHLHILVRSRLFRFPDDLKITNIKDKSVVQILSQSRIGLSDFGVNQKRVELLTRLINEDPTTKIKS